MVKQTVVNLDITVNADGFDISGGATARKLAVTGADVTLTGSGAYTHTMPAKSCTLACTTPDVEHHTADDTLLLAESGSIHTNLGEDGVVTLTLPASAPAGTNFTFVVMVAQELRIKISATSKKFYYGGVISTDDGGGDLFMTADDEAEHITLMADGNGDWFALNAAGTWTVTQP